MRPTRVALLFSLFLFMTLTARAGDTPQEVTIPAGPYQLHGCFWTPGGPGPYAVMIFNHGSEKNPAPCGPPDLGYFYQKQGFAFFTFQRHGHGASKGDYIQHLAMTGISFGGIQTLLTAEKGLGIRAFLAFAPAAQSWNPVLAEHLKQAVRQARAPIFIIQAQNDYGVEPSKVLGIELKKKGSPNVAKIYPSFGMSAQDGHWVFGSRPDGIAVWASDVSKFLGMTMR
jgi:hypothetical protein